MIEKDLNENSLNSEMRKFTREKETIPKFLYVELSFFPEAIIATKCKLTENTSENTVEYISRVYPNLIIRVKNTSGWHLE